ncbi:tetratricopeptide repeat protein [Nitrospira sp. BLG_1]|uniref:tetratricopeptide repeat protein n=1 Tax=Nitrospira sp. BLG_1 TaxID=3395883 RepID=UPI0039BCBB94
MKSALLVLMTLIPSGILLLPSTTMAESSGRTLPKQALDQCHQGRLAKDRDTRLAHFQQGQRLGEQAVAEDEGSADAHFALFCNLGELLRIDGETLTSLFGLRRMMKELDRTLEIAPTHLEAISAKGTLLVKLPGLLGGDVKEGERLLQQVIDQAPQAVNARLALARVRCERGRHDEAAALASMALVIAQKQKQMDFIPEAEAMLQQAKANASKNKEQRS